MLDTLIILLNLKYFVERANEKLSSGRDRSIDSRGFNYCSPLRLPFGLHYLYLSALSFAVSTCILFSLPCLGKQDNSTMLSSGLSTDPPPNIQRRLFLLILLHKKRRIFKESGNNKKCY